MWNCTPSAKMLPGMAILGNLESPKRKIHPSDTTMLRLLLDTVDSLINGYSNKRTPVFNGQTFLHEISHLI